MKLAIMQPYFFPYIGYFQLIHAVDHWVVFDDVQYIRRGWINRNRVLHPTDSWQYVIIPVRQHVRATPIKDIAIRDLSLARDRILGQLDHYRKRAPHFETTLSFVNECLSSPVDKLSELNMLILKQCCNLLDLPFCFSVSSTMESAPDPSLIASERILGISTALGASEYINSAGGRELYNQPEFASQNVRLSFLEPETVAYDQGDREYSPHLSIIDVLMWNSVEDVRRMLGRYTLN